MSCVEARAQAHLDQVCFPMLFISWDCSAKAPQTAMAQDKRNVFIHSSGGQISKTKVLTRLGSQ